MIESGLIPTSAFVSLSRSKHSRRPNLSEFPATFKNAQIEHQPKLVPTVKFLQDGNRIIVQANITAEFLSKSLGRTYYDWISNTIVVGQFLFSK
jgi:hypothetical protein